MKNQNPNTPVCNQNPDTEKEENTVPTCKISRGIRRAKGQLEALHSIALHIDRNPKFHGDEHLPAFEAVHSNLSILLDDLEEDLKDHDRQLRQIFGKIGESVDYFGKDNQAQDRAIGN